MTDRTPAPEFRAAFERTLRLSHFCRRLVAAEPALGEELERACKMPFSRAEMQSALGGPPLEEAATQLRALRKRLMLRLAHRDLNGIAGLDEVFDTMTAFAETAIGCASLAAHRAVAAVHGEPLAADGRAQSLVVAGLGKLGGGELNVSSDVDLVFVYGEDGETSGPRACSNHEFFAAAGRKLIALLAEDRPDGQVFRVDMRLRPYGDSGPLVASLASLEAYFIGQARPWERYAWLKSRSLLAPSPALEALVEPFVYRRYLDYGLLAALRELHARIFEAAVQRRKADDIKVGAGGIREIEFAVQLHQLIRGGHEPDLRIASTRRALAALAQRGLIEPGSARALDAAYAFLRKLEHRLQYYDDTQTQALPVEAGHRATIAEAMGFADWGALAEELDRHRAVVRETFDALFERRDGAPPVAGLAAKLTDPQAPPDPEAIAEDLAAAGLAEPAGLAERFIAFAKARHYRSLSANCRARVDSLLPLVVEAAAREGAAASDTALRFLELIEAIDRREAYLSLLVEYPRVRERAARLVARSRWAARLLSRHPILLDELTRTAASFTATDWAEEKRTLFAECGRAAGDTEQLLDLLRRYKQRQMLRFTIADLEGELPVMALSDELSALADLLLEALLREARASLAIERDAPGLAVIGYGKLGGKELGYGSDLDIVFLYDEALSAEAERFARIAQRVNSWLTSHTSAGVLYDTDLRLRPDGAAGLLVSSMSAYRDYQLKRAWTWEHQALTRARFCAGDAGVGGRFERLRDEILAQPREAARVLAEIAAMRKKMREEHKDAASDLKHLPGGLIDLEFSVQAIVLVHGPRHPKLRLDKGNHQLLRWAGELGLIDAPTANAAAEAYLALRRRTHEAALNDEEKTVVGEGELAAERDAVRRLWRAVFG
jgi:glutamate-ammonia-ligase adenylyltransferase